MTTPAGGEDPDRTTPFVSVIVYAREARSAIRTVLESLRCQEGIEAAEVLVADASDDGTTEIIQREHPWVRHITVAGATMPEGKGQAIAQARGSLIAFIDAFDRAEPGWLQSIQETFSGLAPDVFGIGGEVVIEGPEVWGNLAGYLFEYGAFAPEIREGQTLGDLPGNNMAYRREVFDEICPDLLPGGFYKPFFHRRIHAQGGHLHLTRSMRVHHHIRMGIWAFCRRRYHYGRCFGAMRRTRAAPLEKFKLALLIPVVPALLSVRHLRRARSNPATRHLTVGASLPLVILCVAWGWGEILGTWFGAGRSCRMVY
ncbi:MAG: glycosyltransferase [Planctomycetota bacterium]|nr:glycosyltransferase [Planctomycetota bacterium]MDP6739522.1 glycosyltransferase [Planctomycetota bacterium]MDP6938548.1 glycosyltransferase [Planctomycetota bacterium]